MVLANLVVGKTPRAVSQRAGRYAEQIEELTSIILASTAAKYSNLKSKPNADFSAQQYINDQLSNELAAPMTPILDFIRMKETPVEVSRLRAWTQNIFGKAGQETPVEESEPRQKPMSEELPIPEKRTEPYQDVFFTGFPVEEIVVANLIHDLVKPFGKRLEYIEDYSDLTRLSLLSICSKELDAQHQKTVLRQANKPTSDLDMLIKQALVNVAAKEGIFGGLSANEAVSKYEGLIGSKDQFLGFMVYQLDKLKHKTYSYSVFCEEIEQKILKKTGFKIQLPDLTNKSDYKRFLDRIQNIYDLNLYKIKKGRPKLKRDDEVITHKALKGDEYSDGTLVEKIPIGTLGRIDGDLDFRDKHNDYYCLKPSELRKATKFKSPDHWRPNFERDRDYRYLDDFVDRKDERKDKRRQKRENKRDELRHNKRNKIHKSFRLSGLLAKIGIDPVAKGRPKAILTDDSRYMTIHEGDWGYVIGESADRYEIEFHLSKYGHKTPRVKEVRKDDVDIIEKRKVLSPFIPKMSENLVKTLGKYSLLEDRVVRDAEGRPKAEVINGAGYNYSKEGSWGYVKRETDEAYYIEFHHLSKDPDHPIVTWDIRKDQVRIVKEPCIKIKMPESIKQYLKLDKAKNRLSNLGRQLKLDRAKDSMSDLGHKLKLDRAKDGISDLLRNVSWSDIRWQMTKPYRALRLDDAVEWTTEATKEVSNRTQFALFDWTPHTVKDTAVNIFEFGGFLFKLGRYHFRENSHRLKKKRLRRSLSKIADEYRHKEIDPVEEEKVLIRMGVENMSELGIERPYIKAFYQANLSNEHLKKFSGLLPSTSALDKLDHVKSQYDYTSIYNLVQKTLQRSTGIVFTYSRTAFDREDFEQFEKEARQGAASQDIKFYMLSITGQKEGGRLNRDDIAVTHTSENGNEYAGGTSVEELPIGTAGRMDSELDFVPFGDFPESYYKIKASELMPVMLISDPADDNSEHITDDSQVRVKKSSEYYCPSRKVGTIDEVYDPDDPDEEVRVTFPCGTIECTLGDLELAKDKDEKQDELNPRLKKQYQSMVGASLTFNITQAKQAYFNEHKAELAEPYVAFVDRMRAVGVGDQKIGEMLKTKTDDMMFRYISKNHLKR